MKSIIIGVGPAGVAAGYQLSKQRTEVVILEASACVAVFARSMDLWGQKVDLGPHRVFSRDGRVNELWLELVRKEYSMVTRKTRILYDGSFSDIFGVV